MATKPLTILTATCTTSRVTLEARPIVANFYKQDSKQGARYVSDEFQHIRHWTPVRGTHTSDMTKHRFDAEQLGIVRIVEREGRPLSAYLVVSGHDVDDVNAYARFRDAFTAYLDAEKARAEAEQSRLGLVIKHADRLLATAATASLPHVRNARLLARIDYLHDTVKLSVRLYNIAGKTMTDDTPVNSSYFPKKRPEHADTLLGDYKAVVKHLTHIAERPHLIPTYDPALPTPNDYVRYAVGEVLRSLDMATP